MRQLAKRLPYPLFLPTYTAAAWYLRHGLDIYGVSKILGHSNPMITAKHYAPFVEELKQAHIAKMDAVLEAAKPKTSGNVVAFAR